jgi:cobalt/nickel transport system permease protein
MRNITPAAALAAAFIYAVFAATQTHISLPLFLPLVFLACIKFHFLKNALKKLLVLNLFVIIVVLSLVLMRNYEGALLIFVRSNLILFFVLLLFCEKNEFDIALAFKSLKCPVKLASIIFFTAKTIFLIRREFYLFRRTLYIRGFTPKTDMLSYRTIAGFVGVLFIKTWERADALKNSMFLRGFSGEVYTLSKRQTLNYYDLALILTVFISIAFGVFAWAVR